MSINGKARAGVTLGDSVSVDVRVTPKENNDVVCEMDCNGSKVQVIYRAAGDVDFDTYPFNE